MAIIKATSAPQPFHPGRQIGLRHFQKQMSMTAHQNAGANTFMHALQSKMIPPFIREIGEIRGQPLLFGASPL
jgi:hypothetical protein